MASSEFIREIVPSLRDMRIASGRFIKEQRLVLKGNLAFCKQTGLLAVYNGYLRTATTVPHELIRASEQQWPWADFFDGRSSSILHERQQFHDRLVAARAAEAAVNRIVFVQSGQPDDPNQIVGMAKIDTRGSMIQPSYYPIGTYDPTEGSAANCYTLDHPIPAAELADRLFAQQQVRLEYVSER